MFKYPFTNRQMLILYELLHADVKTSSSLALGLEVSVRTIKSEMKKLNLILEDFDIAIQSKPGLGYSLVEGENALKDILETLETSSTLKRAYQFNKSNAERVSYILTRLLSSSDYIKIDELSQQMYLSRGSINADLNEVRSQLAKFDLDIKSKPSLGMKIVGKEKYIRLAISEYIFFNNLTATSQVEVSLYGDKTKIDFIEKTLRESLTNYNISDLVFESLAINIYIMSVRNAKGYQIDYVDVNSISPKMFEDTKKALAKMDLGELSDSETASIALHIDTKKILVTPEKELAVMELLLDEIYNNFQLDFKNLDSFREKFNLFLKQMIYRLKNDIVLRNALGQQVFRDFVFASKISISASKIIEDYYQIKVPLHEFSYIVLFFQSALNMMEKDNPLVIGFLSGNSNIEKEIYLNELKNEFIKENVEFRDVDKQSADIDLYVSLKRYNDKNTVSILEPNYLTNIKNLILEYKKNVLDFNNYLSEVSILRDIKGDNKEEILKNLVKTLKSNDLLKQGVHSEQDLYPLELGNQVLSLQDYGKIFNKPIFLFVVLRKPVIWDQTTVKVIVLIKTKRDGDHQLHVLCDLLSKWVNDKSAITEFIKETTLENLRKTLLSK